MAKVDKKELYPLFYALHLHVKGEKEIRGLGEFGEELAASVERFARRHEGHPIAPEAGLTPERVLRIVDLVDRDTEVGMLVVEDGPDAPRPKTSAELREEEEAEAFEEQRLTRRFFIDIAYGFLSFLGANLVAYWIRQPVPVPEGPRENVVGSVGQPEMIDPRWLLFGGLIIAAAWGIADAWGIAKTLWLDFDRAKAAVPLVGKKWLERTRRKRREAERKRLEALHEE